MARKSSEAELPHAPVRSAEIGVTSRSTLLDDIAEALSRWLSRFVRATKIRPKLVGSETRQLATLSLYTLCQVSARRCANLVQFTTSQIERSWTNRCHLDPGPSRQRSASPLQESMPRFVLEHAAPRAHSAGPPIARCVRIDGAFNVVSCRGHRHCHRTSHHLIAFAKLRVSRRPTAEIATSGHFP